VLAHLVRGEVERAAKRIGEAVAAVPGMIEAVAAWALHAAL
jgi:hypothetical protein